MEQNKVAIHINGMRYAIKTTEEPAYVAGIAQEIDSGLRSLLGAGSSTNEAMVLLCLSYLDSLKKSEQSADNLRTQVAQYLEDATKARNELADAKRQLEQLRQHNQSNPSGYSQKT